MSVEMRMELESVINYRSDKKKKKTKTYHSSRVSWDSPKIMGFKKICAGIP